METLRFEVIKSGKRLLSIDTQSLRDFINGFIEEDAFLIYDKKMSLEDEAEFQRAKAREIDAKRTIFVFCWEGSKPVGNSSVTSDLFKQNHNAHFGLAVRKGYRGKGIGEKLLSMAIEEATTTLKAKCLWIDHIEGNAPARNLYMKLGFREVARLNGYVRHGGKYVDRIIMKRMN